MYRTLAFVWLVGWALFSVPWSSFTTRPQVRQVNLIPFHNVRRADQIRNFLYYVPAGAIGVGLGLGPVAAVAGAAGLSGIAEISQVFSRRRFPSATDLMLNTAGAVAGAAAMMAGVRRFGAA
jgi:glycopeptide antibiotics resistance protein